MYSGWVVYSNRTQISDVVSWPNHSLVYDLGLFPSLITDGIHTVIIIVDSVKEMIHGTLD